MSDHLSLGPGREFDRVRAIAEALGVAATGLGDDCALLQVPSGTLCVSTDVSVEDTHFHRAWLSADEIGWRATAAALSDLAAEGATPIAVLVALTLGPGATDADAVGLMRGAGQAATSVGARVVGGDLARGPSVALAVTALGTAPRPVTRRGAAPGDELWVTGQLGGARAALVMFERGRQPHPASRRAFARPEPRIAAGLQLADAGATAMLDVSDGLAGDAGHLAAASAVCLEIALDRLPLSEGVVEAAAMHGMEPAVFAAEGGEDYELLAALPASAAATLQAASMRGPLPYTRIGRVTEGSGVRLAFKDRDITLTGYDHFRG